MRLVIPNLAAITSMSEYRMVCAAVNAIDLARHERAITADDLSWLAEQRKRMMGMAKRYSADEERAGRAMGVNRAKDLTSAVPLSGFRL